MADNVKHLLLTRFNVASPGREQAIRLRPGWLEGRFELFRTYCLPSVAAQTRQDFEWVIFFDEKTPEEFLQQIVDLQAVYPFRAVYTGLFRMNEIVPDLVRGTEGADWLLTTRLDSDDILSIDHMERLRTFLAAPRRKVVNFRHGAILSVGAGAPRLYAAEDDSNPFASLMEPMSEEPTTIWGVMHTEIARMAPVAQVGGTPAWLQVVHGGNVSNRIKGQRIRLDALTHVFPHLETIRERLTERDADIRMENSMVAPLRRIKEAARAVAKRAYYAVPMLQRR